MKACNQCGKCCINYSDGGLSATDSEIDYWEVFRPAIFKYVKAGKIWISPDSGKQLKRCPWLRQELSQTKYTCDIYHDRPDDCRHYPVTIEQMTADECETIELKDLAKPKQAQNALDDIMSDSRPPVS